MLIYFFLEFLRFIWTTTDTLRRLAKKLSRYREPLKFKILITLTVHYNSTPCFVFNDIHFSFWSSKIVFKRCHSVYSFGQKVVVFLIREFLHLYIFTSMNNKGVQVVIGLKRKKPLISTATQTVTNGTAKDQAKQCGMSKGSYGRANNQKKWRYDDLSAILTEKKTLIQWLMTEGFLAKSRLCSVCRCEMKLVRCEDRSDGLRWECRGRRFDGKRHNAELSIRKGSWFEHSNMTLEEILKFTYWWSQDVKQNQIKRELGSGSSTAVDWESFCREVCEVKLMESSERIGGNGKVVQIDESKFGKRKYHRGHYVEGQWVFGGIENDSRKCFLVAVDKRDEETLIPIIQRWLKPGTIIVSDCWKAYYNLEKYGYHHKTVNHSKEFVNEDGDNTNKIEGHWRQAKVKLPYFGVRNYLFSSYLAEFMWRYMNREGDLFQLFLDTVKEIYNPYS